MIHGLLWLPLLAVFIGLAWAGWNEYQKLEAYRAWAETCDRAKYDVYAVLGQQGDRLVWGKPTRRGPENLQSIDLSHVQKLDVWVDGQAIDLAHPPAQGRHVSLALQPTNDPLIQVPFTEVGLAVRWATYLQQELQRLRSGGSPAANEADLNPNSA